MATFLDLTLFEHFSAIFLFLLVFVVTYGFLQVSGLFKDVEGKKGIFAIIAIAIAFMATMSKPVFLVISAMTPWFTVLIIFMFLMFFVVRMFGVDEDMFPGLIKKSGIYWVLVVIFIIILIASLSSVFGQELLEDQTGPTDGNGQDSYAGDEDGYYDDQGEYVPYAEDEVVGGEIPRRNFEQESVGTDDFSNNMLMTLVHPRVLGMILIMLIGVFTILFMTKTAEAGDN